VYSQVIKSFQNYRGVATTFYPTLVFCDGMKIGAEQLQWYG
jgi:hypothetical protein